MTRRAKVVLVVGVLFIIVNVCGVGMAAVRGELLHTAIHTVLVLLGEVVVWRVLPRRVASQ